MTPPTRLDSQTALTVDDVASDESFLSLVEHALVRVAHDVIAQEAEGEPGQAPTTRVRFAMWVAVYARAFRHVAASALLTRDDAPRDPWDIGWLLAATRAQWSTMALAGMGSGFAQTSGYTP